MTSSFVQHMSISPDNVDVQMLRLATAKDVPATLHQLLAIGARHGSEELIRDIIRNKVTKLIATKQITKKVLIEVDKVGNLCISVGEPNGIMFSSHMDTVHHGGVSQIGKHKFFRVSPLVVNTELEGVPEYMKGYIFGGELYEDKDGRWFRRATLGADDKAGVYTMLNMIAQNVEGTYMFHVGEESGGIGSRWIASNKAIWLKQFKACIAFDRANTTDVIAHQRCTRSSSIKFTGAIAAALNEKIGTPKNMMRGDVHGSFTDSASYMEIIPECTNISVGYANQHGSREWLDLWWLTHKLIPAACSVNWPELLSNVERTPGRYESSTTIYRGGTVWSKATIDEVTVNTEYYKLPTDWLITDGLIRNKPMPIMVRIIMGAMRGIMNEGDSKKYATAIYNTLSDFDELKEMSLLYQSAVETFVEKHGLQEEFDKYLEEEDVQVMYEQIQEDDDEPAPDPEESIQHNDPPADGGVTVQEPNVDVSETIAGQLAALETLEDLAPEPKKEQSSAANFPQSSTQTTPATDTVSGTDGDLFLPTHVLRERVAAITSLQCALPSIKKLSKDAQRDIIKVKNKLTTIRAAIKDPKSKFVDMNMVGDVNMCAAQLLSIAKSLSWMNRSKTVKQKGLELEGMYDYSAAPENWILSLEPHFVLVRKAIKSMSW